MKAYSIFLLIVALSRSNIAYSKSQDSLKRRKGVINRKVLTKPKLLLTNKEIVQVVAAASSAVSLTPMHGATRNPIPFYRALIFFTSLVYGSTYIATKRLQQILPSEMINFIRFSLATLCFLPNMVSKCRKLTPEIFRIGIELGLWCATGFTCQTLSLQFSSASKAALFTSTGVVIPPLIDYVVDKARLSVLTPSNAKFQKQDDVQNRETMPWWKKIRTSPFFAPVLTVIGAAIIEWGGIEIPHLSDLILFVAPFCFAMTFWRAERTAVNFPEHTGVITGLMLATTATVSGLWALKNKQFPLTLNEMQSLYKALVPGNDYRLMILLVLLGTIATGFTAISEQQALKVLSAKDTVLIYATEPVFAALFSTIFLKEKITTNFLIGAVLILSACILQ